VSPPIVLSCLGFGVELCCLLIQSCDLLTQFLPNKISDFACPAGNASCALNYSPGKTLGSALGPCCLAVPSPQQLGEEDAALSSLLSCFSPAEVPCPESYRAAGEPRAFGSSANGQWRGLVPPLGSVPQKPRVSRGSYLEARKTPRCVQLPATFNPPCRERGECGWRFYPTQTVDIGTE